MTDQFVDIQIEALDDAASGLSGEGALLRIVLKLSSRSPSAWSNYFNQAWQQHIYMMKRRAIVFGDSLEIFCMPNELQAEHIPELNKVISETNQAYRQYVAEQHRIRQVEEERERQQKQELSELKGRLKFD